MFSFLKKEPTIFLVRKMWEFAGQYKWAVIVFWALSFAGQFVWMVSPLVFGKIINELQINGLSNLSYLLWLIAGLFLIDIGGWLFHGPSRVLENITGFKIGYNYKKYLYNGVLSLPLSWHTDHDSGDTIDKVNKATDALYDFSRHSYNVIRVIVRVVGTGAILIYFNVPIAIIALSLLFASFYIISRFDVKLVPQYKEINTFENKANAKVFDSLSNITTVKVLGIHVPILGSIMQSCWASYKTFKANKITMELKWFTGGMIFTAIVVIPLLVYAWSVHRAGGVILAGTISTLYLYLRDLSDVYGTFAGLYDEMIVDKARLQNVEEMEQAFLNRRHVHKKIMRDWNTLSISNLQFSYDTTGARKEFSDFSFALQRGEKIAFIGESGSGKSTLLKILHGMYETASAEISVDGEAPVKTNFADLDLESTLVPQEPEVFSASIRENITLLLDFTDEEIRRASDAAMFTDVIEQLPRKIESVVNEKGVNLSGGQKQRLALTRALLFSKDKKIMLLDESTSSVDPINEVKIYKNIFENFRDATIIASIHKMNLLKYFDRIVILEKGVIRNQGSFNELLAVDAEFKKSWDEFVLSHKGEEV